MRNQTRNTPPAAAAAAGRSGIIDIWINCPSAEVAREIADALLRERLAACCNLFAPISSAYHWRGKIEREEEIPLLLKSREELFERIVERVRALHPYDTPAIVGVPVWGVNREYREWVVEETGGDGFA